MPVLRRDSILLSGTHVPVQWRRSPRARKLSLRIDPRTGEVVVTLPPRAALTAGAALLHDNAAWVTERLARLPAPSPLRDGGTIPIDGRPRLIRHTPHHSSPANSSPAHSGPAGPNPAGPTAAHPGAAGIDIPHSPGAPVGSGHVGAAHPGRPRIGGAWLDGDTLHVSGAPEFLARRATDFLRAEARRRLAAQALAKAAPAGLRPRRVVVKDTRTRWGSCTADGTLMFNWRLVMAPPEIQDYIAAHEVAHLRHMNHGPAFWSLVAQLTPHRRDATAWLATQGPGLMRVG